MQSLILMALLCGADSPPPGPADPEEAAMQEMLKEIHEEVARRVDPLVIQRTIEAATKDRDPKVFRLLVDRYIDYKNPRACVSILPMELEYPVVGLFVRLGPTYVPFLLDRMKEIDPNDDSKRTMKKRCCLFYCIEAIYRPGGDSWEMAFERIRLEIGKSKGRERESLEKCLPKPSGEIPTAAAPRP